MPPLPLKETLPVHTYIMHRLATDTNIKFHLTYLRTYRGRVLLTLHANYSLTNVLMYVHVHAYDYTLKYCTLGNTVLHWRELNLAICARSGSNSILAEIKFGGCTARTKHSE